jgi:hypothetical protein
LRPVAFFFVVVFAFVFDEADRDFDEAMRKAGVDDLSRVKLATLETNGLITIVKRE